MHIVIGLLCFFIFLYSLYLLGRDDYVLIKKNFFVEHLFDFAIAGLFVGFIFARIISIIIQVFGGRNFFGELFSPTGVIFSLTDAILGCAIAYYLIGKYRRLPLRRLLDFLAFSFAGCLPLWYLLNAFLVRGNEVVFYVSTGVFYGGVFLFFWKFLLPRLLSNRLKEGVLSCIFLFIYSFVTLAWSLIKKIQSGSFRFNGEDFLLIGMCFVSLIFWIRFTRKRGIRIRPSIGSKEV
jgi:hypothetical protein